MRRIKHVLSLLCLSLCLLIPSVQTSIIPIQAEDSCTTITYYSKKEWVQHYNLIDVDWDAGMSNFMTSTDILVHSNTFGKFSYPYLASSKAYKGLEVYTTNASQNRQDPNYFTIQFGKTLKIDEIEFQMSARNQNTNQQLNYKVIINNGMKWVDGVATLDGGEVVYESKSTERIKLNLQGKEIHTITVWIDEYDDSNIYTFNYFQVNSFRSYEHTEWITDFIEGTETKQIQVCNGTGNYSPDGNGKWEKKSSTIFSPSVNIVSNYVPIVSSQYVSYDSCRGSYISAYTQPNCIKGMDTTSNSIRGWIESGSRPWNTWYSYGNGGTTFPYITTTTTTGVQYEVTPVYWSQSRESTWINGVNSYDGSWCNHTTGSSRTPCYKHYGHSNNSRLNSYDVNLKTYKNVVDPSLRVIKKTEYYLVNEDTKKEVYLRSGVDELQTFEFLESGKWRIKAVVSDMANLSGSKTSNIFYIDNTPPMVTFTPNQDTTVFNETINVVINPSDEHSGVREWRYQLSKDNGTTWSDYSNFIESGNYPLHFIDGGEYRIKVHIIDNAGNESTTISPLYVIQRGKASLGKMATSVYDIGQPNTVTMKIDFADVQDSSAAKIQLYVDDVQVGEKTINLKNQQEVTMTYTIDKPTGKLKAVVSSDSGVTIENKTLELTVNSKTLESKETEDIELQFKAPVVFMVESGNKQTNFDEELILNYRQDKETYYAGEGIDLKVEATYYNECAIIKNLECIGNSYLLEGTAVARFDNATSTIDIIYENGNSYEAPLIYTAPFYELPFFIASKREGKIFLTEEDIPSDDTPIDAGKKWYTNRRAVDGRYTIEIMGIETAVNKFNWMFNDGYEIKGNIAKQYRIRFVDPDNPFPNGRSNIWRNIENWFNSLRK